MMQWRPLIKTKHRAATEKMMDVIDMKLREIGSARVGVG
jgi:hypothetical protein